MARRDTIFCHLLGFLRDLSGSMITTKSMSVVENTDAELVERSLAGDRDAFSHIVTRYQNLVCSLAYSAVGNLGQSEDVAQETFITAWRHLRHLREPSKLRAWLCGIVHNRVQKTLHREGRELVRLAEPLESAGNAASGETLPSDHTISREEEAILWRSLERIPDNYREPLILFYREHQSIEQVAAQLELSEDAVKQRLSRGRKLLQEEVQAFVESALRQSAPGQAFSSAVMGALPVAAGSAAMGATAAGKGTAAAKSGFFLAWLMPLIGLIGGLTAHWILVRAAPTTRERRIKKVAFISLWSFVILWCVAGQLGIRALSARMEWSEQTFFWVMTGFWWFYSIVLATLSIVMFRRILEARRHAGPSPDVLRVGAKNLKTARSVAVVTGLYLACFWWLIDLAWTAHDRFVAGGIAAVMVILAAWHFLTMRGQTGVAAMKIVIRHVAIAWGAILVILNWRLIAWEASLHGIGIGDMQRLLPSWLLYLLTATLLLWVGMVLAVTRPRPASGSGSLNP